MTITNDWYDSMFGNGSSTGSTTVNINQSVTSVRTRDGSNVTVNVNAGTVKEFITGDSSHTVINNRSIIETITTGKSSSLVLNNSGTINQVRLGENGTAEIYNAEGADINNITGGEITDGSRKGMYIENRGTINEIHTGQASENDILNFDNGKVDWLETGLDNNTFYNEGILVANGNGQSIKLSNVESYLKALGFQVSKDKATRDVEVYSALILIQWYLGIAINGNLNDKKTLEGLKKLYGKGTKVKEILDYAKNNWKPEKPTIEKINKNNGWLAENEMTQVSGTEFLEVNTATAWAMMVQGAISYNETSKSKKLKISSFGIDTGYRSYKDQIKMKTKQLYANGNLAATPYYYKDGMKYMASHYKEILAGKVADKEYMSGGHLSGYGTSQHGWGVAIDFRTGDPGANDANGKGKMYKNGKPIYGTGVATTNEVKWLVTNAGYYGFEGYYYNKSKGYFRETWHWNYTGVRK